MAQYAITQPEPFVLGSGENKYPGGYISRVILNGETVFETLDAIPKFCQQTCVLWCMAHDKTMQSPATPESVIPEPVTTETGAISG